MISNFQAFLPPENPFSSPCERCPVPEEVISLSRKLGLDYGKIEYTLHEGRAAILDVNRTPFGPGTPEATARTVGDLVDGIWSLLPK